MWTPCTKSPYVFRIDWIRICWLTFKTKKKIFKSTFKVYTVQFFVIGLERWVSDFQIFTMSVETFATNDEQIAVHFCTCTLLYFWPLGCTFGPTCSFSAFSAKIQLKVEKFNKTFWQVAFVDMLASCMKTATHVDLPTFS